MDFLVVVDSNKFGPKNFRHCFLTSKLSSKSIFEVYSKQFYNMKDNSFICPEKNQKKAMHKLFVGKKKLVTPLPISRVPGSAQPKLGTVLS